MPQRPQIIQEAARQKQKEPMRTSGKRNIAQRLLFLFCFFQRGGVIIWTTISGAEEKKEMFASSLQLQRITCNFTCNFIAFYQTLPQYFFFPWLLISQGTDKQSFLCCCTSAQHALGYALVIMSFSKHCSTVQHQTELLSLPSNMPQIFYLIVAKNL